MKANLPRFAAWLDRLLLLALLTAVAVLSLALVARGARAGEIVPSVGMTRVIDSGDKTTVSYGLALRENIMPLLTAEIGASYHKDELNSGTVERTQWPVTASLWLRPVSALYAGGGVGWYHTTQSYPDAPLLASTTTEKFGAHLGGGLELPLVPGVASVDLNGRYVYLGNQASELPPNRMKADFWTTSLGLAFHF